MPKYKISIIASQQEFKRNSKRNLNEADWWLTSSKYQIKTTTYKLEFEELIRNTEVRKKK